MNHPIETFSFLCYIIFERINDMNKNYYDILQVNRNASSEIIEKAYKILAKKYHPDLQAEENKKKSEEILKEINEAYETLSNPEKKESYDAFLIEQENPNASVTNPIDHATDTKCSTENELEQKQQQEWLRQQQLQYEKDLAYQQQLQVARQKAYHDAYIQDLKNRGYKIRYKKSLKDYAKDILALVIFVFVLILLWQIPFIQEFLIHMYEENVFLHAIVDFLLKLFQ